MAPRLFEKVGNSDLLDAGMVGSPFLEGDWLKIG